MNPLKISNKIIKIENDNDFLNIEFKNLKIYEHIRMFLYYSEILPGLGIFEKGNYAKATLRAKNFINYIANSLMVNQFWGINKHDILIVEDPNYSIINGVKLDRFTSYFTKDLKNNYCILKSPLKGSVEHYKYGFGKKIFIDYYNILATISSFIINKTNQDELDDISNNIEIGINEGLNQKLNLHKQIKNYIISIYSKVVAARKLIRKIDPKLLITTGYYGKTFLTQVAKENGIPCIELQHGTIYQGHLGYHYPHVKKNSLTCFPDYILLFGEYWKKMADFPVSENRLIPVGYPHFEHSFIKSIKSKPSQILIISQNVQGTKLFELSKDLAKKLKKYKVVYRLHPKQYFNWEKNLADKMDDVPNNLVISGKDGSSLYELMATSVIQIGIFSTALYEGLGFGLKTIICKLPGWENMQTIINNNYAYLLELDNIASFINEEIDMANRIKIDPDYFFKSNSTELIVNTINSIINKS